MLDHIILGVLPQAELLGLISISAVVTRAASDAAIVDGDARVDELSPLLEVHAPHLTVHKSSEKERKHLLSLQQQRSHELGAVYQGLV